MASNPVRGTTLALLIGFALATLLTWSLFIYAKVANSENQRSGRREIFVLSASQEGLSAQLAQQEQATGVISDLQNRISAAARLSEATQARDQVQAQLASAQAELENQRQQLAQVAQQIQVQTQELSEARTEAPRIEQRQAAALNELAAHSQMNADRSQELAVLGGQLEAARQQETQ